MPLAFPSSPSLNEVFQRWIWNGSAWVGHIEEEPYLPLTGGTLYNPGNLKVTGTLQVNDDVSLHDTHVYGSLTAGAGITGLSGANLFADSGGSNEVLALWRNYGWTATGTEHGYALAGYGVSGVAGGTQFYKDQWWSGLRNDTTFGISLAPGAGASTDALVIDRNRKVTVPGTLELAHDPAVALGAATKQYVDGEIVSVKNLGLFAGSFNTHADLPANVSAISNLSANDFVTVRADETKSGATTRYIATGIAGDGTITWTYDITYSTDVTGKMDKVTGAAGEFAMFDASGQVEASSVTQSSIDDKMEKVPGAIENNAAVFDASGQVKDGGAISSQVLQFRPMTPYVFNWIPPGMSGLFVGEGNPTDRPPSPGITKWRFIGTSDGTEQTITALPVGDNEGRNRLWQRTRVAGGWQGWIELATQNSLKFAGRHTRLINSSMPADQPNATWPVNKDFSSGYRASHLGFLNRGRGRGYNEANPGTANQHHFIESIHDLRRVVSAGYLFESNPNKEINFPAATTGGGSYNISFYSANSNRYRKWYRVLKYTRAGTARFPFRINFALNVPSGLVYGQEKWYRVHRWVIFLDCRTLGTGARWVEADGSSDAADVSWNYGFSFTGGVQVKACFLAGAMDDPGSPSGKIYRIELEHSPGFPFVAATITCLSATPSTAFGPHNS